MKQSDPGHFFESQGKTFQPFPYTLFLTSFLTQEDDPAEIYSFTTILFLIVSAIIIVTKQILKNP